MKVKEIEIEEMEGEVEIAFALVKQRTITAQSPDGPLSIVLDVEEHSGNLVQKLTARALIRDLEEGSSWLHSANQNLGAIGAQVKAEIVRLGTTYSLVSKHTSFIAVEDRSLYLPPPPPVSPSIQPVYYSYSNPSAPTSYSSPVSSPSVSYSAAYSKSYVSSAPPPSGGFSGPPIGISAPLRPSPLPSGASQMCAPPPRSAPMCETRMSNIQSISKEKCSSSSSRKSKKKECKKAEVMFDSDCFSSQSEMMEEMMEEDHFSMADISCSLSSDLFSVSPMQMQSQPPPPSLQSQSLLPSLQPTSKLSTNINKDSALQSIVMLQQFDGSFVLNQSLATILHLAESEIRQSIPAVIDSLVNKADVWASILVVQYLSLLLPELQSSWELISDKIKSWLRSAVKSSGANLNDLFKQALTFLQQSGVN